MSFRRSSPLHVACQVVARVLFSSPYSLHSDCRNRPVRVQGICSLTLILLLATVAAGNATASPRATLSWQSTAVSADTTVTDKEETLRLYVRLEGVASVRAASIRVAWASYLLNHRAYSAYDVATSTGGSCTWLWPVQPQTLKQLGDSTLYIATTGSAAASCSTGRLWYVDFLSADTTDVRTTFHVAALTCLLSDGSSISIDSTTA